MVTSVDPIGSGLNCFFYRNEAVGAVVEFAGSRESRISAINPKDVALRVGRRDSRGQKKIGRKGLASANIPYSEIGIPLIGKTHNATGKGIHLCPKI